MCRLGGSRNSTSPVKTKAACKKLQRSGEVLHSQVVHRVSVEQITALQEMRIALQSRVEAAHTKLNHLSLRQSKIDLQLTQVYHSLKHTPIDAGLLRSLPGGTSLFHFVDSDAPASLFGKAAEQVSLLEQQMALVADNMAVVDARTAEVEGLAAAFCRGSASRSPCPTTAALSAGSLASDDEDLLSAILDASDSRESGDSEEQPRAMPEVLPSAPMLEPLETIQRFTTQQLNLQHDGLGAVTSTVVSAASLEQRVRDLHDQFLRFGSQGIVTAQVDALESSVRSLPSHLAKAEDSLQRAGGVLALVEAKLTEHQAIYENAGLALTKLKQLEPILSNTIVQTTVLEKAMHEREEHARYFLDELENLVTWYSLFHTGYGELLHEITRRREEEARQQRLVDAFAKELAVMHKDEASKREEFFNSFGQYLPATLCPVVMEPAVTWRVASDFTASKLPVLSSVPSRPTTSALEERILSQKQSQ